jgi:hypothetical protein
VTRPDRARDATDAPRAADAAATAVFALACAAAAPGVIAVFPRAHYLVAPCALGWLLATTEAFAWLHGRLRAAPPSGSPWRQLPGAAAIAVALWLVVPRAASSPPQPQPVRRATAWLRSQALTCAPVFSGGVDLATLAGYECPVVPGWRKREPLFDLLEREGIGLVLLEDRMLGREAFATDPQVRAFLLDPDARGFCERYRDPGFVRIFVGALAQAPRDCLAPLPSGP